MKALYSHWSAPEGKYNGYRTAEAFRRGLSLSVLMADQFYDCVLVTDSEGWDLISSLDLPWVDVHFDIEELGANSSLWSLGKLKAMKQVEPPFVHIDHDVILHKPLPGFDNMLMQSWEGVDYHPHYKAMHKYVEENPDVLSPYPNDLYDMTDSSLVPNCGIIGCRDAEFRDRWTGQSLRWVNRADWDTAAKANPEQHFFIWSAYVEQVMARNVNLALGGDRIATLFNLEADYEEESQKYGYTHLISDAKRQKEVEKIVEECLKERFPEQINNVD